MAATSENKPKQYISVGILAHVDAGKTTLSEGILYLTGQIRKLGRVDHGDAFLDTYTLERSRGITIFSKQANFVLGDEREFLALAEPFLRENLLIVVGTCIHQYQYGLQSVLVVSSPSPHCLSVPVYCCSMPPFR